MLPFGGQGSNMAMEDAGALGFLFQGLDGDHPELIGERLALFEKVRKNRASRVQVLSKVRGGREKVVEDEVRRYADGPTDRKYLPLLDPRSFHGQLSPFCSPALTQILL
jgi:salicylate hydroxylase